MSRLILQIDVDGVLADFVTGFTTLAYKMFGCPITATNQQPTWDGFPGITKEQESRVWDRVKRDTYFWAWLTPLVDVHTWTSLHDLNKTHDVYFVTSRVGYEPKWQTEYWLEKHGIQNPTVIVSSLKGEVARCINATHSIEDKAGNAICIQHMSRAKSYIIDRPYNRFPHDTIGTKVKRVSTVEEFLNDLEGNES